NCPWKRRPTSGGRRPRAADFETCRAPRESIAQTTNRSEGDTEGKSERENKSRNDARWLRGRNPEGVCEMLVSRMRTFQVWRDLSVVVMRTRASGPRKRVDWTWELRDCSDWRATGSVAFGAMRNLNSCSWAQSSMAARRRSRVQRRLR